ncbi:MAG: hypothetical protein ATN35_05525 [Epulopiscium sp. Nele67-Bin004]|nr:MAG: hypothetical protein ATN35_05525 [Epulopiscium sp. Nele67-Bin004]
MHARGHARTHTLINNNIDDNTVTIGDDKDLFTNVVYANTVNFMTFDKLENKLDVAGKIRYSHTPSPCTIEMVGDDRIKCTFDEPQRAITPGQAIVFYDGEKVIGGATIE